VRVAAVLLLFFATTTICDAVEKPKTTRLQTLERAAVYASVEFDAAATYNSIHSCSPGYICTEANPVRRPLAGNPAIFPVMAGSVWAVDYVSRRVSRNHLKGGPGHAVDLNGWPSCGGIQQCEALRIGQGFGASLAGVLL